jgi:hypothetical protein
VLSYRKPVSVMLGSALLATIGASAAHASIQTFTSESSFAAAAGSLSTLDLADNQEETYPQTISFGGFTFSDSGGVAVSSADIGYSGVTINDNLGSLLTIDLPAGDTAIGFDAGAFYNALATLTLTAGASSVSTSPGGNAMGFVGFVSTTPISSVTLSTAQDEGYAIQNIDYVASPVPEPASLGALGIGGLVLLNRRRRFRGAGVN